MDKHDSPIPFCSHKKPPGEGCRPDGVSPEDRHENGQRAGEG